MMKAILITFGVIGALVVLLVVVFGPGALLGLAFGLLAGVPSVLLVLLTMREPQATTDDDDYGEESLLRTWHQPLPYQPPVIVLAAPVEEWE